MKNAQKWLLILSGLVSMTCRDKETILVPVDLLTDPGTKPAVIYTYPPQGSQGPYDNFSTSVTVRFNKLMDLSSLQRAARFSSTAGNLRTDTSRVASTTGDVASIDPVAADPNLPFLWKVGQTYTLRISETAKDLNGNRLSPAFVMTIRPEPSFRVKSMTPSDGSINIKSNRQLRLQFNSYVDTSLFPLITFSPALPGTWLYYYSGSSVAFDSSLIFFLPNPGSSLSLGTVYTLSITSGAHDRYGNSLAAGFVSSFETAHFGVTSTSPSDGTMDVDPSSKSIRVYFNDTLDETTVGRSLRIDPATPGTLSYTSNGMTFYYYARSNLRPRTKYTVTVDTSLRTRSGIHLAYPYTFSFTTRTFQVTDTSPVDGDTAVFATEDLYIYFNAELDTSTVRGAFSITPAVNGFLKFSYSPTVITYSPISSLTHGTTYTVRLGTTLEAEGGTHLAYPYSFSFTVAPFAVTGSSPSDGETHTLKTWPIMIYANDVIDTSTVRGSFLISPAVSGHFNLFPGSTDFEYRPSTELQPLTVYTVTVGTTLHSEGGAALLSPYRFSFSTGQ